MQRGKEEKREEDLRTHGKKAQAVTAITIAVKAGIGVRARAW